MSDNTKLLWKFEKFDYIRMKSFIRNKECLSEYIDSRYGMEYCYTLIINKIEYAFKILKKNDYFKRNDMNNFIENNDYLYVTEHFRLWQKMYGFPNSFVLLIEIEIFEKALKYLEETLQKYNLLEEYNDLTENITKSFIEEGQVV